MLHLQDVSAGYGRVQVLEAVTLDIAPGKIVALLGPNGAGKTTLMRVASGLLRPTRGKVEFEGKMVSRLGPDRLARLGVCLVPEGRGIFPSLTVRDNLQIFARTRDARGAIDVVVQAFPELASRLDRISGSLSGGEQQMLALGRTCIARPKVALLDEVSVGLAPMVVERIYEFLRNLARSGSALLLVEQYIDQALAMADHVYVLSRGRIVKEGRPADIGDHNVVFNEYFSQSESNIGEK